MFKIVNREEMSDGTVVLNDIDAPKIARKAKPVAFATDEQKRQIREYIARFGMTPEQVSKRLAAYGADSLDDLTEESARIITGKLEAAIAGTAGEKPSADSPEANNQKAKEA